MLGDELQVLARRVGQVGERAALAEVLAPAAAARSARPSCGAAPSGGRGSRRTRRLRRRGSSCTPGCGRAPRARRAWSRRARSACSGARRSAARPGRASRCAAGGRSSCRTRRRAARMRSPISSCSSLGNGPAPTRVVYALAIPQTSSMLFGPMPVPTQAAPASGLEEVTNGYVPWSMSSIAPCAPSKITFLPSSSRSHISFEVSAMCCSRRWPNVRYSSVIVCRSSDGSFSNGRSDRRLGSIAATIFFLRIFSSSRSCTRMPKPRRLVGVARADAASRGADLQAAELGLAGRVEQQVVGHDQVRVGRDAQAAHVHAPRAQRVELARSAPSGRSPRRCRSRSACPGRGSPTGSGGASTPRRRARSCGPALLPPWKRTTASPCSASRSVILPLPSSPHWAPTITIPGMSQCSLGRRRLASALAGPARPRLARERAASQVRERAPTSSRA